MKRAATHLFKKKAKMASFQVEPRTEADGHRQAFLQLGKQYSHRCRRL